MSEYEDVVDGDDEYLEGDDDDGEIEGDEILGASKRRRRGKKGRKPARGSHGIGNMYLKFASITTAAGNNTLTARAVRECRPVDLRVSSDTADDITVLDLQVHGTSLFNSAGAVASELMGPGTEASGPNCDVPEIIKGGEDVTLSIASAAGGSLCSAVLKCRSTTK
jgi:hypothetical protein